MAGFLEGAFNLLSGGAFGGNVGVPGITGQGIPLLPAFLDPFEKGGIDIFAPGRRDPVTGKVITRRRRRRRALTNQDRQDIAFIAGIVSRAEAGRFANILAARTN